MTSCGLDGALLLVDPAVSHLFFGMLSFLGGPIFIGIDWLQFQKSGTDWLEHFRAFACDVAFGFFCRASVRFGTSELRVAGLWWYLVLS